MILHNKDLLKELVTEVEEAYENEVNLYNYPSPRSDGLLLKREENFLESIVDERKELNQCVEAMQRSSYIYLTYKDYAFFTLENKELSMENFTISTKYAYLAIKLSNISKNCFGTEVPVFQKHLSLYISQLLIFDINLETKEAIDIVVDSLVKKNNVILHQDNQLDMILYFILALHAKMNKIELDIGEFELPSFTHPYDKILQIYDTKDIKEVDRWVYLLCDTRLELIKENENFNHITTQLFAYEILAWLAIRKEIGLQNPKEFSHPLMNIPIVKLFLQIQTPLPKPTKLLYVDELLEKIESKCLDVKIDNDALSQNKKALSNTLAPKTGRYRATLPNEHPQAKQLESDPHSYARFKKDDTFTYEGLEDYDLSEITWSYLGE